MWRQWEGGGWGDDDHHVRTAPTHPRNMMVVGNAPSPQSVAGAIGRTLWQQRVPRPVVPEAQVGRGEGKRGGVTKDTAPLPGQGEPSRERLKRGREGVEGCGGGRTGAARAGRSESREAQTRAREVRRLRRGEARGPPQGDRTPLPAFRPPSCSATAGAALAATARRRRRQSRRRGPSERCMWCSVSQVPATGCWGESGWRLARLRPGGSGHTSAYVWGTSLTGQLRQQASSWRGHSEQIGSCLARQASAPDPLKVCRA